MINSKEEFIKNLSKYEKAIRSSVIYDCLSLFKLVEKTKDLQEKKVIAKTFSSFLWNKYIMDKDNAYPENNLVDLIKKKEVKELLMDTANLFSFISDEEENESMIGSYREKIIRFLNNYGKNS